MEQQINKVFITGGDIKYLPFIEVMVKSIQPYLEKSKAKLIVYSFNCDYNISGVECRRLYIPKVEYGLSREFNVAKLDNSLFYAKYVATLNALNDFEYVCWLDGDSFVLDGIEKIWNYTDSVKNSAYPLFMHYLNKDLVFWRKYQGLTIEAGYGTEMCILFNKDRNPTNMIVASGLYLVHQKHIDFFENILKRWEFVKVNDCCFWADMHAFSEERLTNLSLWEMNADTCLPITWINYASDSSIFTDSNILDLVKRGFDIMYLEENNQPIMVHGPNPIALEKTSENLKIAYDEFGETIHNLMIVAHPDDETIFGGFDLLTETNWTVVCLTGNSNELRKKEYIKALAKANVSEIIIHDLPDDDMMIAFPEDELFNILKDHISQRSWKKIVTHNFAGEYGHPHHHQVHNAVVNLTNNQNVWVFNKSEPILHDRLLTKKKEMLQEYTYAKDFIEQILTHNGRWFLEKDMTTNYIENGRSIPIAESIDRAYIPCFNK